MQIICLKQIDCSDKDCYVQFVCLGVEAQNEDIKRKNRVVFAYSFLLVPYLFEGLAFSSRYNIVGEH